MPYGRRLSYDTGYPPPRSTVRSTRIHGKMSAWLVVKKYLRHLGYKLMRTARSSDMNEVLLFGRQTTRPLALVFAFLLRFTHVSK